MKGVRITLTIEPDESRWGFLDALTGPNGEWDLNLSEVQRIAAVVELAHEDLGSLLEEARWKVEFI